MNIKVEVEKYHCKDGPAVEYSNGHKEWWINGLRHREDGPALIYADGCKEWFWNDMRHRKNSPALIWNAEYNFHQTWRIKNVEITRVKNTRIEK